MCIDRQQMPQIDWEHYPELWKYLDRMAVTWRYGVINPELCQPIQCMPTAIKPVKALTAAKPALISTDYYILDGNHRWLSAKQGKYPFRVYQIEKPVDDAIDLLRRFPHSYAYGDGAFHPCKI